MSLKHNTKKDNKLSPKYYNPYNVLQNIGSMAYKLELPASSRVHPIFYVSYLNKVISDKLAIQMMSPKLDEEGKIILDPEEITEIRTRQLQNQSISEYLIKWKNLPTEDTETSRTNSALRTTLFEGEGHVNPLMMTHYTI